MEGMFDIPFITVSCKTSVLKGIMLRIYDSSEVFYKTAYSKQYYQYVCISLV